MSKIVVTESLTLDGVMQAPGRPDEDLRGGFEHGGWALSYNDEVMGRRMGERMARGRALLFGRRTYEDFSRCGSTGRTTLHRGAQQRPEVRGVIDAAGAASVGQLHAPRGGRSGGRGRAQAAAGQGHRGARERRRSNIVDEFVLLIYPLVVGSGRRLFPDGGAPADLRLVDSVTTTTGVVIATYEVAEPATGEPT
jgi:dihydrofolate reductase